LVSSCGKVNEIRLMEWCTTSSASSLSSPSTLGMSPWYLFSRKLNTASHTSQADSQPIMVRHYRLDNRPTLGEIYTPSTRPLPTHPITQIRTPKIPSWIPSSYSDRFPNLHDLLVPWISRVEDFGKWMGWIDYYLGCHWDWRSCCGSS
jgi:hypothetical protein